MKSAINFLTEVKVELGKIVWPTFDELVGSVIVVLLLVAAFALYLGAVDLFFYRVAERVF